MELEPARCAPATHHARGDVVRRAGATAPSAPCADKPGSASHGVSKTICVRNQSLLPSLLPSPAETNGGAGLTAMMMQGRTVFSEPMLGAKSAVHHGGEWAKAKKRSEFVEDQAVESEKMTRSGLKVYEKKRRRRGR